MRKFFALLLMLVTCQASAIPLDDWPTWVNDWPYIARSINPSALIARGIGTDAYYVLEVDPTTGALPVDLQGGSISIDYSGPTGSPVPADAAYIGGKNASGDLTGISVDANGELQVDVLSSALPSGAATSAKQDSQTALLTTIDADTGSIDSKTPALGQAAMAASVPVAIASNQSAVPVSDGGGSITVDGNVNATNFPATVDTNSGAAGASTIRFVPATRSEAAATPLAVRISNGSSFSIPEPAGRSYADSARNAYASVNVTTGAWVQLIASTAATINCINLFDSSGQTLELGTGAVAAETRVLIIPPGGLDGCIPLAIASGTRVSVRAISGTASVGEIDITGLN